MQVIITLSGPQGSGKTVLAELIAKAVGSHTGVRPMVEKGSQGRGGPEYDRIVVNTTPEILREIAQA